MRAKRCRKVGSLAGRTNKLCVCDSPCIGTSTTQGGRVDSEPQIERRWCAGDDEITRQEGGQGGRRVGEAAGGWQATHIAPSARPAASQGYA